MPDGDRTLAIFIDFENLALGFQGRRDRFEIGRVLERLVEKGKIVVKKAYADWSRFMPYTQAMHEAAIELIEIPKRSQTGKNSADIRLCVDAIDMAYAKDHISTFVIVSGDSDFSPLVSKLKENGKHVIGLGTQDSTSELLRDNCDEFIYYEDLGRKPALLPEMPVDLNENKRKALELLMDSLLALRRENKEVLWSSMVKDTMKRKKPSFNETYHGYRTFSELLEDAQAEGLLELETDKRSGTYVVKHFGTELSETGPGGDQPRKRKRRRKRGKGNGSGAELRDQRDEPRRDEPRRDEPRRDEPRRDEPRRDEPRRDQPRRDEGRRDEPRRDEARRGEPRDQRGEPRRVEVRRDEARGQRDEPQKDEPHDQRDERQEARPQEAEPRRDELHDQRAEPVRAEPEDIAPEKVEPQMAEPERVEPQTAEPERVEPEPESVEPENVEPPEKTEPEKAAPRKAPARRRVSRGGGRTRSAGLPPPIAPEVVGPPADLKADEGPAAPDREETRDAVRSSDED